jgi:hypothetical protein
VYLEICWPDIYSMVMDEGDGVGGGGGGEFILKLMYV